MCGVYLFIYFSAFTCLPPYQVTWGAILLQNQYKHWSMVCFFLACVSNFYERGRRKSTKAWRRKLQLEICYDWEILAWKLIMERKLPTRELLSVKCYQLCQDRGIWCLEYIFFSWLDLFYLARSFPTHCWRLLFWFFFFFFTCIVITWNLSQTICEVRCKVLLCLIPWSFLD